jgi:xylulokinase
VLVPAAGEYVAAGAARQAAWVLSGAPEPPDWTTGDTAAVTADPAPHVREAYAHVRDSTSPS